MAHSRIPAKVRKAALKAADKAEKTLSQEEPQPKPSPPKWAATLKDNAATNRYWRGVLALIQRPELRSTDGEHQSARDLVLRTAMAGDQLYTVPKITEGELRRARQAVDEKKSRIHTLGRSVSTFIDIIERGPHPLSDSRVPRRLSRANPEFLYGNDSSSRTRKRGHAHPKKRSPKTREQIEFDRTSDKLKFAMSRVVEQSPEEEALARGVMSVAANFLSVKLCKRFGLVENEKDLSAIAYMLVGLWGEITDLLEKGDYESYIERSRRGEGDNLKFMLELCLAQYQRTHGPVLPVGPTING